MPLTLAQLQAIKADIAANPDLAAFPEGSDGAFDMAVAYNLPPAVPMSVWQTAVPVEAIFGAINWSAYTPVDTADGTVLFQNRLLVIQTKQMNLQNMLTGRTKIDASKDNIRAGLRDAVIAIPAGAGGASVSPGGASGVNVLNVCVRPATRAEKLLNTGSLTTGTVTAFGLGFEGKFTQQIIEEARAS